ncbi:hypothetical protein [Magnetospirillum sp. UT-4]|uniref:hypothetical protein n=1 Tax=Magnetospirillum sp. UT-4 TaxID=2681467 RepID=UPI0013863D42|nr:hypothetical protein [Magnetospirillum sp. UT-4]CAA7613422.1 conserved exported hypothetical protein [Magnetospirillum sp. UT-4]
MTASLRPFVAALALAPVLASCSILQKKEPPPCPPIYVLGDAGQLTHFRDGKGRDLTDIEFEAEIQGFTGGCTYDEKGAVVDLQVSFTVKRGPADGDRKAEFSYFAAIPLFYPSPAAKAVFPIQVEFPEGNNYLNHTDETVMMRIPVKDKDVIQKYEIYLGFQATAEEIERNRAGRK